MATVHSMNCHFYLFVVKFDKEAKLNGKKQTEQMKNTHKHSGHT